MFVVVVDLVVVGLLIDVVFGMVGVGGVWVFYWIIGLLLL